MTVSIIAAMSKSRVIGRDGAIPWSIPADMRRFRELTLGHTLIMGRKTFESIGRALPGRRNIIVTRQPDYHAVGAEIAASLAEALRLAAADGEIFICGGGNIYTEALSLAARVYLTVVDLEVEGNVFFPSISAEDFEEVVRERISLDPPADFMLLRRTSPAKVCGG